MEGKRWKICVKIDVITGTKCVTISLGGDSYRK